MRLYVIVAVASMVVLLTGSAQPDTITVENQKTGQRRILAQDVIADTPPEAIKDYTRQVGSITYIYWNEREGMVLRTSYYARTDEVIKVEYSPPETKSSLLASFFRRCVAFEVIGVTGSKTVLHCPQIIYSTSREQMFVFRERPKPSTQVHIRANEKVQPFSITMLQLLKFHGKEDVELTMTTGTTTRGVIVNPHADFVQELVGLGADGNYHFIRLDTVVSLRRVKSSDAEGVQAQDKQIAQATNQKKADSAKVLIDFPSSLKSRSSYYNISGPVWVFKINFREVNGVGAEIHQKRMRIYSIDGNVWGDYFFEDIYDTISKTKIIKLQPNGSDSYESWVNSPSCDLCGAKMLLEYLGNDAKGNTIQVEVRFTLDK